MLHPPGRLIVNDAATHEATCLAGYGIAQLMEFAIRPHMDSGWLIDLFRDWHEERFPLYCIYPSRQYLPAKARAFLDLVTAVVNSGA